MQWILARSSKFEVFVFTGPIFIQSLSSVASGFSVVHSGNQSTFCTAVGWKEKSQKKRENNKTMEIQIMSTGHYDVCVGIKDWK